MAAGMSTSNSSKARESSLEGSPSTSRDSPSGIRRVHPPQSPPIPRLSKDTTLSPPELRKQILSQQETKIATPPSRLKSPTPSKTVLSPKVMKFLNIKKCSNLFRFYAHL